MAARFTVNLGNVYVANKRLGATIRKLLEGRPDVIAINEGRHAAKAPTRKLLTRRGFRQYVAPYGQPAGRTDVLAYVHKRNRHLGYIDLVVNDPMPAFPAGIERHLAAILLDTAVGPVAVVIIHPSPGPEALVGVDDSHPLVRAYLAAMTSTEATLNYLEELGYRVILTGDVQLRASAPRRPWSPYLMLDEAGIDVTITEGLDVIAHGPGLEPVDAQVLAAKGTAGDNDHDLLTATYRKAQR